MRYALDMPTSPVQCNFQISRRLGCIVALGVGLSCGAALKRAETTAHASTQECDSNSLRHEFESFRRVSGSGNEDAERAHWEPVVLLVPTDPSLVLMQSDDDDTVVFLDLRKVP